MGARPGAAEPRNPDPWASYLTQFHQKRSGITEDVLRSCVAVGIDVDPYRWLTEPLLPGGRVLDLACGSAPVLRTGIRPGWVGVDRSFEELDLAVGSGATGAVVGDATALPFADQTFSSLVCSMALMLFRPLALALTEIKRVMSPGATGSLLLPDRGPLRVLDVVRYTRLLLALRLTHFRYPNDEQVARLPENLSAAGLTMMSDSRARFLYPIADRAAADRLVRSLYLPEVPTERLTRASDVVAGWSGSSVGIPLRRVVFQR